MDPNGRWGFTTLLSQKNSSSVQMMGGLFCQIKCFSFTYDMKYECNMVFTVTYNPPETVGKSECVK